MAARGGRGRGVGAGHAVPEGHPYHVHPIHPPAVHLQGPTSFVAGPCA